MNHTCREFSGTVQIHTDATKSLGGTVPAVGTPLAGATVTGILSTTLLLARHPTNTVETAMIHDHSLWWGMGTLGTDSHSAAVTLRFMNTQHFDLTIMGNITCSL
jgi:hypothetical protein